MAAWRASTRVRARRPDCDAVAELVLGICDDLRALADGVAAERVSWPFSLLRPRGY
jgi:hypothetical protein